jgi:NitT/TauT family transport system substrate-binding protein
MTDDKPKEAARGWLARRSSVVALGIVTLPAGIWLWALRAPSPNIYGAMQSVKIATVAYVGSCPVLVASSKGYFADEGVAAQLVFRANGKDALTEVLQQRADLATVADIPIVNAALEGQHVSVIGTMSTMEDHAILGRTGRGIGAPESLRGKRVGVTIGTTTQFFLDAFLNRHGLSPSEVTLTDLAPKALANSIVRGEIDAAVLYQPLLERAAAELHDDAIIMSGQAVYDVLFALAGDRDYVAAHRPALAKIVRASLTGAQSCKHSPEAARTIVAQAMKTDPRVLSRVWPSYLFEIALRQGLLLTLEDNARWAINKGLTHRTNVPNFLNNLDSEPLRSVAPTAVTVIH